MENTNTNPTPETKKKGKKKGFLKKVLIIALLLALIGPVINLLTIAFSGILYTACALTRDTFTVVAYVDEHHITLADKNGEEFDIELIGITMNDETALEPYIGTEVSVKNAQGQTKGFGTERGYILNENNEIIQIYMLLDDTASMTDEEHYYVRQFDYSDCIGTYRN